MDFHARYSAAAPATPMAAASGGERPRIVGSGGGGAARTLARTTFFLTGTATAGAAAAGSGTAADGAGVAAGGAATVAAGLTTDGAGAERASGASAAGAFCCCDAGGAAAWAAGTAVAGAMSSSSSQSLSLLTRTAPLLPTLLAWPTLLPLLDLLDAARAAIPRRIGRAGNPRPTSGPHPAKRALISSRQPNSSVFQQLPTSWQV